MIKTNKRRWVPGYPSTDTVIPSGRIPQYPYNNKNSKNLDGYGLKPHVSKQNSNTRDYFKDYFRY